MNPAAIRRHLATAAAIALLATLLPAAAVAQDATSPLLPEIVPSIDTDTAVRAGLSVEVSGPAPGGASLSGGRFIAVTADDEIPGWDIAPNVFNRGPGEGDYVRVVDGALEGQLTLGCEFGDPAQDSSCAVGATDVVLELTTNGGETARSEGLRVDYTRPVIRRYDLVDVDQIVVVFSEPVRDPAEGSDASDWEVRADRDNPLSEIQVSSVDGARQNDCVGTGSDPRKGPTGCTRTLHLGQALPIVGDIDEDSTPWVDYLLGVSPDLPISIIDRTAHNDFASNAARRADDPTGNNRARSHAVNRVRPALPDVSIPGTEIGHMVVFNDPEPTVTVGNLRDGHTVDLTVTSLTGQVVAEVSREVDGTSETFALDLPADGLYRIRAVATDPHGNTSDDEDKHAARDDGRPEIQYVLDTVPPVVTGADRSGPREVVVEFSESVEPEGDAGTWRVGDQDATAEGTADRRVLSVAEDIPDGALVSWSPDGSDSYTDVATNPMAAVSGIGLAPLPVIGTPVVTTPGSEVFTSTPTITISGTAGPGQEIFVLAPGGDGVAAETTSGSDGAWSVGIELGSEGRYRFEVEARDPDTGARSGGRAAVPDIVLDTTPPDVDVTFPDAGPIRIVDLAIDRRRVVAPGDTVDVRWVAEDPASGDDVLDDHGDRVDVSLTLEDGGTEIIGADRPYIAGEPSTHSYLVRASDLAQRGEREATFGVTVTDLAGNVGDDDSFAVLIVGNLVGYEARFTQASSGASPGTVEIRFPEELSGATSGLDWAIRSTDATGAPTGPERRAVTASTSRVDGRTVVTLGVPDVGDPNRPPEVRFAPQTLAPGRLMASGSREVSRFARVAADAIPPALEITAPASGPRNSAVVTLGGTTDQTQRPNGIAVRRLDGAGNPTGAPVASTTAGSDGSFTTLVPLRRNAVNRFGVQATDPAGNRSTVRSFQVIEDSLAPVVTLESPVLGDRLTGVVDIRWSTDDLHPATADVHVRVNDGPFMPVALAIPDQGHATWDTEGRVGPQDTVTVRVRATDRAGNTGEGRQGGLNLPLPGPAPGTDPVDPEDAVPGGGPPSPERILRAVATGERTVDVHFSGPVSTGRSPAGFSIVAGPGVAAVVGSGTSRTLHLNADLETTTPLVSYAAGGVTDADGRILRSQRIEAERAFAFAPQDLVAGSDTAADAVTLSWVDERNAPGDVDRYEVRRGEATVGVLAPSERTFTDTPAGTGARTYEVRTVDDLGNRSRPATLTVDPNGPNITPRGGHVLSPDGQVALIVPPGAVDQDYFGRFEAREAGAISGASALGSGYVLVAEAAGDRSRQLETFSRYSCLSFRPGAAALDGIDPGRLAGQRLGEASVELSTRGGRESARSCVLTPGAFALSRTDGASHRVYGPDPAFISDRFATAVGLSQSSFTGAGAVVIARADDYPDALAASALAEHVGGPILLTTTGALPTPTALEILRLGATEAIVVGGHKAVSPDVAAELEGLGLSVSRISGPERFTTAAEVARRVGVFAGTAYVATGLDFADALAVSGPSAALGRPVLLTAGDVLPGPTRDALLELGVVDARIVGGEAAVGPGVVAGLHGEGLVTDRVSGPERFATAVALAQALRAEGLDMARPVAADGSGVDGTSPDALASGPVAGRNGSPLLLVPRSGPLPTGVRDLLAAAPELGSMVVAGGTHAVPAETRAALDAAAR